jgi:hypothetical protein
MVPLPKFILIDDSHGADDVLASTQEDITETPSISIILHQQLPPLSRDGSPMDPVLPPVVEHKYSTSNDLAEPAMPVQLLY